MQYVSAKPGKAANPDTSTHKIKGIHMSFFSKVFIFATVLVLVCTTAISAIIYSRMNGVLDRQNEELMRYSTAQIRINVENIIENMDSMANTIYSDSLVWELLQKGTYTSDYIRFQKHLNVENMIQNLSNGNKSVKNVTIYNNDVNFPDLSKYFRNKKQFMRQDLLEKAVAADGKSIWVTYKDTADALRVLLLKDINIYQPGGVLVMELNTGVLSSMYEIYTSNNNVLFLLDNNNTVITTNDKGMLAQPIPLSIQKDIERNLLFSKIQYNGSSFYSHYEDINGSWKIVMLYNSEDIEKQKTATGRYILISAALFTILGLLFALYFSRRFTVKLERLVHKMKLIETGTLNVNPDGGRQDEFYALDKTLCTMARKVDTLTTEIIQAEKLKNDSEIKYLQMQMNPHFLYNLLSAARWMAVQNAQDSIVFIIDHLCNFYRMALSDGHEVIKLKTELSLVESYVALQSICYTDRINLSISIDKGLENMDICKMTLQPFVENSIVHGKIHGREINIKITAEKFENSTRLAVEDDGYGMPDDVIAYGKSLSSREYASDKYYGITNTFARVNLFCSSKARISFSNKEQGSLVELFLPM